MKLNLNAAAVAAALTASLAFAVPSFASSSMAETTAARSEVVKYNDLNLATTAGVETLYGRLRVAVWRVCRDSVPSSGGSSLMERGSCMRGLMDAAVKDVNKASLTALHEGRAIGDLTARR